MIGRELSHFRITDALGEGGMGEVYLADDLKLDRQVAIKVLPEEFTYNPKRLARFEREARLLASLNHPNIAALFQVEQDGDIPFLVMEYVSGENLAQCLERGPIAPERALKFAVQIASGLESAHDKGIIHRDLKPSNIKVTPEDKVLLLDFGVAKAMEVEESDLNTRATTLTAETVPGSVIGTPAYMSPEQAKGDPVDRRADIWAFGCVLYEMLTGQRPYDAGTPSETLGAIFHLEPNFDLLPRVLHPTARSVIKRCLQKDPQDRLRDIGDARIEIQEALQDAERRPGGVGSSRWSQLLGWAAAAALAIALVWAVMKREDPVVDGTQRLNLELAGPIANFGRPNAVPSPDGSLVAYSAQTESGPRIHTRALNSFESQSLAGTEGAQSIFFSPDGEWIGFWANHRINKIPTAGGPPEVITETAEFAGAAWQSDGSILFSGLGAIVRVTADGSHQEPVSTFEPEKGEMDHRYPQILPGGSEFLYEVSTGMPGGSRVAIERIGGGEKRFVLQNAAYPRYASSGHLLFLRSGVIQGVALDPENHAVRGTPVRLLEDVSVMAAFGFAQFSVSSNGTLVYLEKGPSTGRILAAIDRTGAVTPLLETSRSYYMPRISPDGSRLAVTVLEDGIYSIWIVELESGTSRRLPLEGNNLAAVWSPDGKQIAYAANPLGGEKTGIFIRDVEGAGTGERMTSEAGMQFPTSWAPDSSVLLYTSLVPSGSEDVFALAMDGSADPFPVAATKYNESAAVFSPDGRWIAYTSPESGIYQVYLVPYPELEPRRALSTTDQSFMPTWAADELFFLSGFQFRKMMSRQLLLGASVEASTPVLLFEHLFGGSVGLALNRYDIAPDGATFYFATPDEDWTPTQINVVLNWLDEVERLIPLRE